MLSKYKHINVRKKDFLESVKVVYENEPLSYLLALRDSLNCIILERQSIGDYTNRMNQEGFIRI